MGVPGPGVPGLDVPDHHVLGLDVLGLDVPGLDVPGLSVPDLENLAREALDTVCDPELDEPITDLGFVRSVAADGDGQLTVHLRLPTAFCAPNFAYLMASDAKDALLRVPGAVSVTVLLDDHHDSDLINRGLAADAGYRGTFGAEAEEGLDELRLTFQRKAHTAAMERALTQLLRSGGRAETDLHGVTLGELPDGPAKTALLRRRAAIGLPANPDDPAHASAPVLVDDHGNPYPEEEVPLRLRRARSTRVSIDGNAHFCRGLLRTRYPGSGADQAPRASDPAPRDTDQVSQLPVRAHAS